MMNYVKLADCCEKITDYVASGSFASLKANVLITNQPNYAIMVKTADFSNGFTKGLTYTDKHGYEFLSNSNLFGGELILSNIGSIGKVFIVPNLHCPMTLASNSIMVKPNKDFSVKYLYYLFSSKYGYNTLLSISSGTSMKKFNKTMLKEVLIQLRTSEEQHRIVHELDDINLAIENKKQVFSSLDELVKSRFIEMFGEPLVNEYNFPKKKLSDTFLLSAGGTPKTDKKEYWDNGTISWIGSNMCQNQILYQNDGKYITELGLKNSSAKIFDVDTVLIALVGATIGKTALLKFPTATNQNVLGIQKIANVAYNPYFVYYYMQGVYDRFIDLGDGKFKMASKGFVGDLEIFVVDLHLQNEFAEFVKLIDKSKFIVQQQIKDLQELLDSKMDEYFR